MGKSWCFARTYAELALRTLTQSGGHWDTRQARMPLVFAPAVDLDDEREISGLRPAIGSSPARGAGLPARYDFAKHFRSK